MKNIILHSFLRTISSIYSSINSSEIIVFYYCANGIGNDKTGGTISGNTYITGDLTADTLAVDSRFFSDNTGTRTITPIARKTTLASGQTFVVGDGEQAVVFGNYTIDGNLIVTGTGEFIVITGVEDSIARYDDDGILTDSLVKINDLYHLINHAFCMVKFGKFDFPQLLQTSNQLKSPLS